MKAPLLNIRTLNIHVSILEAEASVARNSFLEPGTVVPAAPKTSEVSITPPAIGEYWVGQGGIYGGLRHYPEGLCHIIFATADVGKHAYGEHGNSVEATSNIDGRENTAILVNREGSHPAAAAASAYTCDGHKDFYLPSSGELHHGYLYLPESFEKDWYISSTQRSADTAYIMVFEVGWLDYYDKSFERLARPVRRFLQ